MTPPKCHRCGKPLKRFTRLISKKINDPDPEVYGTGTPILKITHYYAPSQITNTQFMTAWLGRWGYRGHGLFCSAKCGYEFGCGAARAKLSFEEIENLITKKSLEA